ncbi:MAG: heavy metal translocating P-type ATPase metal-binding domain-containing protein, partial [Cyclobacteriaceae bacterium]
MITETTEKIACKHCGERCEEEIRFDENTFCCYGCKAVYELLSQSSMLNYYDNGSLLTSKISIDENTERKYAFLDHEEIQKKLFRYHDENKAVIKFNLPGIHCSSCIYLLEHLPRLEKHILHSQVNFIRKEVTITFQPEGFSLKKIAVLLSSLGYPPSINLDALEGEKTQKKDKNGLGLKVAVAGFCFGNSMLMSLPEYLDTGFQLDEAFKVLFSWINLVLAIPIVFYSGFDYFKNALIGLKKKYLNIDVPIALGIFTLFARSFYEIVFQAGAGYVDSLAGLVFFLLIGKWYQSKTYEALSFDRDYKSYFPISVTRIVGQLEENVLINDLEKGDFILIRNQELIPADCTLVAGEARLDYSFVTGETELIKKSNGARLFAGGRQVGGPITVMLSQKVNNSELTQLWNNQIFDKEKGEKYENLIDKVSYYFTAVIILLALSTAIYWYFVDSALIWNAVTAVLIIACPCALALTLPFAYGHGMRLLGRKGLYLKSAIVIERLAHIKEIIFDKTGTLTESGSSSLLFVGEPLNDTQLAYLKTITSNSAHPLSRLIAKWIGDRVEKLPISTYHEILGKGAEANINGVNMRIGSGKWINDGTTITNTEETSVYVKIEDQVLGYFVFQAKYRHKIFDVLTELRTQFGIHLLSGDVAKESGRLEKYFDRLAFHQTPENKLEYIRQLHSNSLMIGDGLNDAGALKAANVGFGVAEDVYQFSPACDAVLSSPSIERLGQFLLFSKAINRIVIFAFIISFAYNIVGLSFAMSGQLSPVISAILMPISSLTVVGIITILAEVAG